MPLQNLWSIINTTSYLGNYLKWNFSHTRWNQQTFQKHSFNKLQWTRNVQIFFYFFCAHLFCLKRDRISWCFPAGFHWPHHRPTIFSAGQTVHKAHGLNGEMSQPLLVFEVKQHMKKKHRLVLVSVVHFLKTQPKKTLEEWWLGKDVLILGLVFGLFSERFSRHWR